MAALSPGDARQLALRSLAEGDPQAALRYVGLALASDAEDAEALRLQGIALAGVGDYTSAIASLQEAVRLRPANSLWWRDLATAFAAAARWLDVLDAIAHRLRDESADADALQLQAQALLECHRPADALRGCQDLVEAGRTRPSLFRLMGRVQTALGQLDAAVESFRHCLELEPESVATYELLADLYHFRSFRDEELECRERIQQLRPDAASLGKLATSCWNVGDVSRSVRLYRDSLSLVAHPGVHSWLLTALLHDPSVTAAELLVEHTRWAAQHGASVTSHHAHVPDANRPLRVGYLAGEFVAVPASYFLLPFLRAHSPARVEVYCYHSRPWDDSVTAQYRKLARQWRDVHGVCDEEVARIIRDDRIDALVDLSGHYPGHRLRVFTMRPAPVQLSFPNYPSTTGLGELDGLFTDAWTSPPGTESEYSEPLMRLPSGYLAYEPPDDAPPLSPGLQGGTVTFGFFQRPSKVNAGVWDVIARVLLATPGTRLLVHHASGDLDRPGSPSAEAILGALESRGVVRGRVTLLGARPVREHLLAVAQADIVLDAFPYTGQTTTCECLWMGLPVVTMEARGHVGRVSAGLLRRAGLSAWVASTMEEYVAIAAELAASPPALAHHRATLRDVARRTFTDGARLAREMEQAYTGLWQQWCGRRS